MTRPREPGSRVIVYLGPSRDAEYRLVTGTVREEKNFRVSRGGGGCHYIILTDDGEEMVVFYSEVYRLESLTTDGFWLPFKHSFQMEGLDKKFAAFYTDEEQKIVDAETERLRLEMIGLLG